MEQDLKKYLACALLFFILHTLGVSYLIDVTQLTNDTPIVIADYGVHAYNTLTLAEMYREGHSWFYDPHYMGGYPAGVIFDISSKTTQLFTAVFGSLLGDAQAFKIFIVLSYILAPLLVYPTVRYLNFEKKKALIGLILALILWDLDPFLKIVVDFGGYGFILGSYLALLTVATFYQLLQEQKIKYFVLTLLSSGAAILAHPITVIAFGVACVYLLVQEYKNIKKKTWIQIGILPFLLFILHSYWVLPFLQFLVYKISSAQYMQSVGILRIFLDVINPLNIVRSLAYGCAIIGLLQYKKNKPILALGITSAILFVLCYIGTLVFAELGEIQPFRFYLTLLIFLIPAATTGYFFLQQKYTWLNKLVVPLLVVILLLYPFRVATLVQELPAQEQELITYLEKTTDNTGRILFETAGNNRDSSRTNVFVDHFLPLYLERQMIGGPYQYYYIKQGYANFVDSELLGKDLRTYSSEELQKALVDFNIHWIIARKGVTKGVFDRNKEIIVQEKLIGEYAIYKIMIPTKGFSDDPKALVVAKENEIQVTGATQQETILKYHYLETLTTKEGFRIEPYDTGYSVPMIKVHNNGQDFTVINSY